MQAASLTSSLLGAGLVLTLGLDRMALVMQQAGRRCRRRCRGRQEVVRGMVRPSARARDHLDLAVVRREGGRRQAEWRWQRRRYWWRGLLMNGDEGGLPRPGGVSSLHAEIGRLHRRLPAASAQSDTVHLEIVFTLRVACVYLVDILDRTSWWVHVAAAGGQCLHSRM